MATISNDRLLQYRGAELRDREGDKIGRIEEIYLDTESGAPEWALVNTGLFGTKSTFVPLRDAQESGDALEVPFDKATVKDAPKIDSNGQLSRTEEGDLYRHYGLEYRELDADTAGGEQARFTRDEDASGTVGRDVSGPETDDAMTRSEEELRVGTAERESGRVRLRKYIVTDEVQQTVPVKREEVRLEREPITDANRDDAMSGGDLTEEEHEVVLHEEEVVAEKRTVPKERVRLDKDVEVDERTVTEEVRREQVDVDDDRS